MAVNFIGEGNRFPGKNHSPAANHRHTLTHNVFIEYTSSCAVFELTTSVVICTDIYLGVGMNRTNQLINSVSVYVRCRHQYNGRWRRRFINAASEQI